MKIGVVLLIEGREGESLPSYRQVRDLAQQAEASGFDSLWLYDHLLFRFGEQPPVGHWDCWTFLPALAEATRTIRLGTLVACSQFRNPALVAKMAISLDEVSGGRFTLGLGAGWNEAEFKAFGFPFDHRVSRFEEQLKIIAPLLREGAVDFHGTYHRAEKCEMLPRGPRPGGPPLMIAAFGPRMHKLTAQYADLWNVGAWPESLPAGRASIEAACTEIGRNPSEVSTTVSYWIGFWDMVEPPANKEMFFVGSNEEIALKLAAFEQLGVAEVMLHIIPNTAAGLARATEVVKLYRQMKSNP